MGDLVISAIVITLTGAIVIGIFLFSITRSKRQSEALKEKGWEVRTERRNNEVATLLSGDKRGIHWQMEIGSMPVDTASEAGSGYGTTMRWWTHSASLPGEMLLIGPRVPTMPIPGIDTSSIIVKALLAFAVKMLPGGKPEDAALLDNARLLSPGSGTFRDQFMVIGRDEMLADTIADAIEIPLTSYAMPGQKKQLPPNIILWPRGVVLAFNRRTKDVLELERIVELGCEIAARITAALPAQQD